MRNTFKITLGTIALLGVFAVYAVLDTTSYTSAQSATTEGGTASVDDILGNELQSAINTIKGLKLDGGIFKDQAFLTLKNISVEIPTQPVSRDNPLLPIPVKK